MNTPNTHAGLKYDQGKPRPGLLPSGFVIEVAKVLSFGAAKYGDNNWQGLENFTARYTDALYRHLEAWRGGEECDKESGLHHLSHAACNIAFLLWKEMQNGTAEIPKDRDGSTPMICVGCARLQEDANGKQRCGITMAGGTSLIPNSPTDCELYAKF